MQSIEIKDNGFMKSYFIFHQNIVSRLIVTTLSYVRIKGVAHLFCDPKEVIMSQAQLSLPFPLEKTLGKESDCLKFIAQYNSFILPDFEHLRSGIVV